VTETSGGRQQRRRLGTAVLVLRGYIIAVANGRVCVIEKWRGRERMAGPSDRSAESRMRKDHAFGCDLAFGEPVNAVVGLAIAGQAAASFPIVPGGADRIDASRGSVEGVALLNAPCAQRMNDLPGHNRDCSQTADILTIAVRSSRTIFVSAQIIRFRPMAELPTEFANCGSRATGRRTGSPTEANCSKAQISDLERGNRGLDIDWMRRIAKGARRHAWRIAQPGRQSPAAGRRGARDRRALPPRLGRAARQPRARGRGADPRRREKAQVEGRVSQQNASVTKSAYCEQAT
jgi:hypothetical protein